MPPDERDDEHSEGLGQNEREGDGESRSQSQDQSQRQTPEPQRGFGVRIAFYLLITLFVLWAGSLALLVAFEGTEATKEMLQRAAEGDELALSTVLAFWLQVATAPLVLLVTWAFVRSDGTSLAHLGARRPRLSPDGSTVDSAAVDSAAVDSAAVDSAAVDSAAVDSAAVDTDETTSDAERPRSRAGSARRRPAEMPPRASTEDPVVSASLVALGVVSALLVVGAWRILAAQWAGFRVAESFPESELESMGGWLPLGTFDVLLFTGGFLVSAFVTELIFRGYVFTTLRRRLPWVHAAGISALFFTLFQPTDDAVLAPSLLNLFLLGMLFAALREATGSLWPATAFHATWNLLIATLLSLPLSGWILPRLHPVEMDGPEWVTGGGFGPEGSWLMTAFLVPAVLAAAVWMGDVDGAEGTAPAE